MANKPSEYDKIIAKKLADAEKPVRYDKIVRKKKTGTSVLTPSQAKQLNELGDQNGVTYKEIKKETKKA